MSIGLCILWFIFGLVVGQLLLIGLAGIISTNKEGKNAKEKRDIRK